MKTTESAAESAAIPADQTLPWVGYWDEYPETADEIFEDSHEYAWIKPTGIPWVNEDDYK